MRRLSFLFIVLLSNAAYAQQRFTLADVVNTTLKNSLDIEIAKNNLEINSINNNIGNAGGLPTVNLNANYNENSTSVNQKLNNGNTIERAGARANTLTPNVQASILLFNGFRVKATQKRLQELELMSKEQLNAQIQNAIAEAMVKYYDIVRQQSYFRTIRQSIELSAKRLEILQAKKEAGLSNNVEIYQAEVDLNARKQDLQTQQLILDQAKTDLLNIMNMKPDLKIDIQDTILVDKSIVLDSVMKMIPLNPQLLSANQMIRVSEQAEKEIQAQRYPAIRFNTGFNYSRNYSQAGLFILNQSYGPFAGINLQMPLYNGGILKRQEKTARIDVKNATLQRDNLVNALEAGAVRTYQGYRNALQQRDAELKNYATAQTLLDLIMERYKLNQATILDVREAQKSFEDAGYRLVNLSYAAKVAEIELKRLSSTLLKD
ncbi:MAG: TolC family protein [Chitinophagaceae bacterium]|nr:TolC family protein [Chitinophagaceae bacterium]